MNKKVVMIGGTGLLGRSIKIINRNIIKEQNIDYIIILAHNFSEYIIKSLNNFGYKGKYITFLPEIRIQ